MRRGRGEERRHAVRSEGRVGESRGKVMGAGKKGKGGGIREG